MTRRDSRDFTGLDACVTDQEAHAFRDRDMVIFERSTVEKQRMTFARMATDKRVGVGGIGAAKALRLAA